MKRLHVSELTDAELQAVFAAAAEEAVAEAAQRGITVSGLRPVHETAGGVSLRSMSLLPDGTLEMQPQAGKKVSAKLSAA